MLALLALLGALWTAPPCDTAFCRCIPPPRDVQAALDEADAVFAGRVVDVRIVETASGWPGGVHRTTVQVERVWKGVKEPVVEVLTSMDVRYCGFAFRPGESYLVFARRLDDGTLMTSICSATVRLREDASGELSDLFIPRPWRD